MDQNGEEKKTDGVALFKAKLKDLKFFLQAKMKKSHSQSGYNSARDQVKSIRITETLIREFDIGGDNQQNARSNDEQDKVLGC